MTEHKGESVADLIRHGCHGVVTRGGEQDACGKPATVIIDGRDTEAETYWPACTYHGNRYGAGRVVPLTTVIEMLHCFDRHSGMCRCGEGPLSTPEWVAHYKAQDEPVLTRAYFETDIRETVAQEIEAVAASGLHAYDEPLFVDAAYVARHGTDPRIRPGEPGAGSPE